MHECAIFELDRGLHGNKESSHEIKVRFAPLRARFRFKRVDFRATLAAAAAAGAAGRGRLLLTSAR